MIRDRKICNYILEKTVTESIYKHDMRSIRDL